MFRLYSKEEPVGLGQPWRFIFEIIHYRSCNCKISNKSRSKKLGTKQKQLGEIRINKLHSGRIKEGGGRTAGVLG